MSVVRNIGISAMLAASLAVMAPEATAQQANATKSPQDQVIDSIFYQEARLVEDMHKYTPLVETYIQNTKPDPELGEVPVSDKYFLGRLILDKRGINDRGFDKKRPTAFLRVLDRLDSFYKMNYLPEGFMQLLFLSHGFDKQNYELKYQRQEFLGDVRTLVFDAVPNKHVKGPHFVGRIWVEDQDHHIVRINGTYVGQGEGSYYFHFDSWRMNLQPGLWLPTLVYTEDSGVKYDLLRKVSFKGQTRLWAYDIKHSGQQTDFTDIQVDSAKDVSDKSGDAGNEINPVESTHKWQREAEDNVLDRMERSGILAPPGDVSNVLETVVNNLEITNQLDIQPDVRCRVLLTTPLESFTVGNTIVLSRGLLDVLPDEASLAVMLAHELAHIVLEHSVNTMYAFSDRMLFPDEDIFQKIGLQRSGADEAAADQKAIELLRNSPYKDKLGNAGLFLRALQARSHELTWLINPNFGNKMATGSEVLRMTSLIQSAPELKPNDANQLASLPLGSRIGLDPWNDRVTLKKSKPETLRSARDKMPFEVTPMIPNLVRATQADGEVAENANAGGR